ncbi:MAG: ABC transporter permease [Desulfococcaceae bacterium]
MQIISLSPCDLSIAALLVIAPALLSVPMKLGLWRQILAAGLRTAIQLSLIPIINSMSVVGIVSLPGPMLDTGNDSTYFLKLQILSFKFNYLKIQLFCFDGEKKTWPKPIIIKFWGSTRTPPKRRSKRHIASLP